MSNLLFEEMIILSKAEKKARRIKFSPTTNLVLGENDVGKSTLIKSLYHALGADTPALNNHMWQKAKAVYLLKFSLNKKRYCILRDDSYFGLFDETHKLLGKYKGISRNGGIADGINPLLKFNVELENKDDDMSRLSPAYYFLPFYIDQDSGWNASWCSFKGLPAIKNYRKAMLEYHLGIRPQGYYDAKKQVHQINADIKATREQKNLLITVRDSYKKKKSVQGFDINLNEFKEEIEQLVADFNKISEQQNAQLNLIKQARNEKIGKEGEIAVLRQSICELEKDYLFCESPATPEEIGCPTCGTHFSNSITERFGLLDDIDYCRLLIDQKQKDVRDLDEKLRGLDEAYSSITRKASSIDDILKKKRGEVTFAEIVSSEGYKEIMGSIGADITNLDSAQADLEKDLSSLDKDLRVDSDLKKKVYDYYQRQMKSALNSLNVHVLAESDYKDPLGQIKENAIGSDMPRSMLAQHMSYLHTMQKFSSFISCPLVIDSPLQQEQDKKNADAIFKFIFSSPLKEQQLIVGTLSLDGLLKDKNIIKGCHTIKLEDELSLLQTAEYDTIAKEILPLHERTLASE